MSIKNLLRKIGRIDSEGVRTSYLESLRPAVKSQRGLSLVEVVVVVFVVSAVAFLAAPIVFPGDSKTADAQVRSDIDLLKQVMDLRMTSYDAAKTGGLGVEANIGVYAAYAQFEGKATLDANGKPAFYCLKGTHPTGLVLYYTSKDGAITPMPLDLSGCPGGVANGGKDNGSTPAPTETPNPLPSQSGQPAATPIPTTQSGANN